MTPPAPTDLFAVRDGILAPAGELLDTLRRIRTLYGAGMGFASVSILAVIVKATIGLRWTAGSEMEGTLAAIDADISQALQSAKEEMEAGRAGNLVEARRAIESLRSALAESVADAERQNGSYPFERGVASLEFWKI